ncbi:MAG: bifunctional demethylmenaquinone methyltransferase/2-methoxy-6-polyprenyl-1,4-benzoquinol methylase UbiE [Candidatus Schekmanbacteria bacterium]|nr:bifunctional demethylmenaquinone methyltransferase/2-methoxy-6-polyprenyl-1,4-benzoquinol methylase UbiE [Candidatus Schekmanbacteria bacterium]
MKGLKEKIEEINRPENRKEKERYVRSLFDGIAPKYDLMNSIMSIGLHNRWRDSAIRKMGVFPGAYVLDCCCGTADFALAAAKSAGAKGRVLAFDFSTEMLVLAKVKIKEQAFENIIRPHQADALKIPVADNSFDFATVGWGIRNLSDMKKGLSEIFRALKPGGKFACLDLGRPVIPVYAQVFYLSFFYLVPKIGKYVAGNEEAYAYLPTSLHTFPKQKELQKMMEDVGFIKTDYTNLLAGAMAIHYGQKPN